MTIKHILAAATVAISIIGSAATAASVSYTATSHLEGGDSHPEHSVWFGDGPSGAMGSERNHFLFENSDAGSGLFTINGATAQLSGIVKNAAGQGFEILMNFISVPDPLTYKGAGLGDPGDWLFFGLDESKDNTLISLDNTLNSFDISLRGPYAVQFGLGANDKNAGLLGLSTWIWLDERNCNSNECERRHGDVNILLEKPGIVPVPASIALMPVAIGLMGIIGLRRRRKS